MFGTSGEIWRKLSVWCCNCQISFGTGFHLPPYPRIPFEQHLLPAGGSLRQFKSLMKHVPKILKYSTSIPPLNLKFFRFKHQMININVNINIHIHINNANNNSSIIWYISSYQPLSHHSSYYIYHFVNFGHWYIDCDRIKVKGTFPKNHPIW